MTRSQLANSRCHPRSNSTSFDSLYIRYERLRRLSKQHRVLERDEWATRRVHEGEREKEDGDPARGRKGARSGRRATERKGRGREIGREWPISSGAAVAGSRDGRARSPFVRRRVSCTREITRERANGRTDGRTVGYFRFRWERAVAVALLTERPACQSPRAQRAATVCFDCARLSRYPLSALRAPCRSR